MSVDATTEVKILDGGSENPLGRTFGTTVGCTQVLLVFVTRSVKWARERGKVGAVHRAYMVSAQERIRKFRFTKEVWWN